MLPEEETDMGNLNKEFVVIQDALQLVFMPVLSNLRYNGMARLYHNGATEDFLHLGPNALDCTLLFDREPEFPASESVNIPCLSWKQLVTVSVFAPVTSFLLDCQL